MAPTGHDVLFFTLVFFVAAMVSPESAWSDDQLAVIIASSPMPVGSGARAAGMGNAFVAVADDATAASWNPAGLLNLEVPEVSAVGSLFHQVDQFGSGAQGAASYDGGTDTSTVASLNYLSGAYPFELLKRNVVASLNYQRKLDFNKNADLFLMKKYTNESGWPFKDSVDLKFQQEGGLGTVTPCLAVQIYPFVAIGASFNYWMDELGAGYSWRLETDYFRREESRSAARVISYPRYVHFDEIFENFEGMNWTAGIMLGPFHKFSLGAVYNTRFTAELKWRQNYLFADDTGQQVSYQTRDLRMTMPESWALGIAYRHSDRLLFSADFTRIEWSKFVLRSDGGGAIDVLGYPYGSNHIPASNIARVGMELLFFLDPFIIPIRAGGFYDPQPGKNKPRDFFGFALGSGFVYRSVCFDWAYQLRMTFDDREVNLFDILGEGGLPGLKEDLYQHLFLFSTIVWF